MSSENEQLTYIGLTSTTFKERYDNHDKSFNHDKYENETELIKYVSKLKKKKFNVQYHFENNEPRYNKEKAVKPMFFVPKGKTSNMETQRENPVPIIKQTI